MGTGWRNWCHVMGNTYGTWLPGNERGYRTRHHREHVEGDYKHPPPPSKHRKQLRQAQSQMKRPPVWLTEPQRQIACRAMVERLLREGVEVIEWVVTSCHFHGLARFTPWVDSPLVENPGETPIESPGIAMPGLSTEGGSPPLSPPLSSPASPPVVPPIAASVTLPVTPPFATSFPRPAHVSPLHGPLHKRPVQIDPVPRQMVGLAKKHSSHIAREQGVGAAGGLWAVRCKVVPVENRPHQVHLVKYIRDHVEEGGVLWSAIYAQLSEVERLMLLEPYRPKPGEKDVSSESDPGSVDARGDESSSDESSSDESSSDESSSDETGSDETGEGDDSADPQNMG